jgi:RNA polymerase sigma-70 factor (ECF subfamily)
MVPAIVAPLETPKVAISFDEVYSANVGFVWRVLRALGVPPTHLEDAAQDVFVVVHRRLGEFEGRSAITTWLFAITRKVAASHRRKHGPRPALETDLVAHADPFADTVRIEAARTIAAILDRLDDDRRIVFALVELEQIPVAEVARVLDLNVNTAYSRLRLARADFAAAAKKLRRTP